MSSGPLRGHVPALRLVGVTHLASASLLIVLALAIAIGCGSSDERAPSGTPAAAATPSAGAPLEAHAPDIARPGTASGAQPGTIPDEHGGTGTDVETETSAAAQPEPGGAVAAAPSRPRLAPSDARAYRAEIAAARREARGDPARGLAAFERLIAAHPTDPRLHCEAGLLAHRAGRLEDASRLLASGTRLFGDLDAVPVAHRAQVAMCLFNRGLVLEAAREPGRARDAYRDSLRLRPSAVVERHLAALPPIEPPPVEEGASIESLVARLVAEADAAGGEDFRGQPLEWALEIEVMAHRAPADGAPELALLQLSHNDVLTITQQVVLVVGTGAGYRLFPVLADIDDMTDHGNTDMVSLGEGRIDVITTSAGPVVRASFAHGHTSGVDSCDDECCRSWSSRSAESVLVLCTLGEAVDCQPLDMALQVTGEGDSSCEEEDASSGDPDVRWARSLAIDPDGTTHLRVTDGAPPEPPAPGDRPFASLVRILAERR